MAFVVTLFGVGGGGGGLWDRDRIVAACRGVIMGGEAQEGSYGHHTQDKEDGASRPAAAAAVVDDGDGLLGGRWGKSRGMVELVSLSVLSCLVLFL